MRVLCCRASLQSPQFDGSGEVGELGKRFCAFVENFEGFRIVPEELVIHFCLLSQHFEVMPNFIIAVPSVHLFPEAIVPLVVKLMQFGDSKVDDVKILFRDDGVGCGQRDFHGLHILQHHAQTLQVNCF